MEKPPRSKRVYIYWGVALALLLAAGLFCWLIVVPVAQTDRVISDVPGALETAFKLAYDEDGIRTALSRLGGPEKAGRKLALCYRALDLFADDENPMPGPMSFEGSKKVWILVLLGHCDRAPTPIFRKALKSPDASIRMAAIVGLGVAGPRAEGSMPLLIDILRNTEEYASPRMQTYAIDLAKTFAAEGLGEFGPEAKEAVPLLQKLLKSERPPAPNAAREALKKIRGEKGE